MKVNDAGRTVATSGSSLEGATVTSAAGATASTTVHREVPPSARRTEDLETFRRAGSVFVTVTDTAAAGTAA